MGFTFDQAAHEYRLDGTRLPSVTQIIQAAGIGPDYSQVPPDILERKRLIGERVHRACRLYDEGTLDVASVAPEIEGYVEGYFRFTADTQFEVLGTEVRLFHDVYGYAGTPDLWGHLGGRPADIDRKTLLVLDIPHWCRECPSVSLQNAGYAPLIQTIEPHWRDADSFALQLRKDGTYRLVSAAVPAAAPTFFAALAEACGEGSAETAATIDEWRRTYHADRSGNA